MLSFSELERVWTLKSKAFVQLIRLESFLVLLQKYLSHYITMPIYYIYLEFCTFLHVLSSKYVGMYQKNGH